MSVLFGELEDDHASKSMIRTDGTIWGFSLVSDIKADGAGPSEITCTTGLLYTYLRAESKEKPSLGPAIIVMS